MMENRLADGLVIFLIVPYIYNLGIKLDSIKDKKKITYSINGHAMNNLNYYDENGKIIGGNGIEKY